MGRLKQWEELTIQDNFLFQKVMQNRRICKHLIEKINIPVNSFSNVNQLLMLIVPPPDYIVKFLYIYEFQECKCVISQKSPKANPHSPTGIP